MIMKIWHGYQLWKYIWSMWKNKKAIFLNNLVLQSPNCNNCEFKVCTSMHDGQMFEYHLTVWNKVEEIYEWINISFVSVVKEIFWNHFMSRHQDSKAQLDKYIVCQVLLGTNQRPAWHSAALAWVCAQRADLGTQPSIS